MQTTVNNVSQRRWTSRDQFYFINTNFLNVTNFNLLAWKWKCVTDLDVQGWWNQQTPTIKRAQCLNEWKFNILPQLNLYFNHPVQLSLIPRPPSFSMQSSRVLKHKATFLCTSDKGVKKKAVFHLLIPDLCPGTALDFFFFLARIN